MFVDSIDLSTTMNTTAYSFRSCIRGYHEYKDIWDAVVGEVLDCEVRLFEDVIVVMTGSERTE